ncbi:MAG TPA: DevR family CRISPR-associated autoregulator, partial [Geobacterales bacterium]|nr:DevR family CRISPR-associated autoregulator [Geobacterales bacterium]
INEYENKSELEIEKEIIKNCIVEDIGGFLVASAAPEHSTSKNKASTESAAKGKNEEKSDKERGKMVRRTSIVQFSYMIPTLDGIDSGASTTDVQMQVRMANNAQNFATSLGYSNPIQAPYNKEIASSTYSFMVNLDLDGIGYSSYTNENIIEEEERNRRIDLIFKALKLLLDGNFGAGKSRYNPFILTELVLLSVSKGPALFTVSPPSLRMDDFILETVERAKSYMKEIQALSIHLYLWINEAAEIKSRVERLIEGLINKKNTDGETNIGLKEYSPKIDDKRELKITIISSRSVGELIQAIQNELKSQKQEQK